MTVSGRSAILVAVLVGLPACNAQQPEPEKHSASAAAAPVTPTTAMGAQVFKRCAACHTVDKGGANGVGPNLHAVVGRAVASVPGFAYSAAMRARGGAWDTSALDAYLAAPAKFVPGNRMAFAGIGEPAERQALILYLEAQN